MMTVLSGVGSVCAESVSNVKIRGNQRVEAQTILAYIPLKEGDSIDQEAMNDVLKSLFATGYFADVSVTKEGGSLVVSVVENASINKIAFEGNSKIKDEKLLEEIQMRPREVASKARIISAQQKILELYRQMGRFSVTVDPKVIKLDQNRVDLVFEIHEGDAAYIRHISFVGNKHFKSSTLEKHLYSKKKQWYRFFASDDIYDANRFVADQHALRDFYLNHGHPDFYIVSAVSELTPDQKDFFLTFTINEGPLYKIQKVDILSSIPKLTKESLLSELVIQPGDVFSQEKIEKTIEKLTEAAGGRGYAFADIQPRIEKDRQNNTVSITFEIQEGRRVYVERINMVGNTRTRDHVLRREIRVHEGDAYNTSLLKKAKKNLENLGYFKTVDLETEQGSATDKAVVSVKVEEQPTGELMGSGGWSTLDGPLLNVKFSERNFMGTGRIVRAEFTVAKRSQDFEVGITDPYFMGKNISVGIDLFRTRSTRLDAFTESNTGITPHVGYALSENWYQMWSYILKNERISKVPATVSEYIQQQAGSFMVSALGHTLIYDRRDSQIEPTSGFSVSMGNTFAGIGANKISYFKNSLSFSTFYTPIEDVTMNLRGSCGMITKVGGKVIRVADSFYMGADSFRGFQFGGIGPRDMKTGDSLGGTRFWITTFETVFPIGLPNDFGVKGAVFAEFGSVWKTGANVPKGATFVDAAGATRDRVFDSKSIRGTVGFGLSWTSPMGPIRIDYGFPVMKQKADRVQRLTFGFSTRF